jgi:hypothetical protein
MLRTAGGRPGLRRLLVSYLLAASLRCQASSVAGVRGKDFGPAPAGNEPCQRSEPHPVGRLVPHPAGVAAQHRVLVPEHQQLSLLGPVPAEHHDSQAEYPANKQVDDLEQHPASQPSPRQACWQQWQVSRSIEYSSGTGRVMSSRLSSPYASRWGARPAKD